MGTKAGVAQKKILDMGRPSSPPRCPNRKRFKATTLPSHQFMTIENCQFLPDVILLKMHFQQHA